VILSIDSTSEWGSIALTDRDTLVEEVELHSPDGFGHVLFPALQQLLARHNISVKDLDSVAAASGPGSFTGVRVGLAAVKGLAEAAGKKAVAVSNLRALASFGTVRLRAAVMDARRGEVYVAVYDNKLESVLPETVAKLPDWLRTLPADGLEFVAAAGFSLDTASPVIQAPRALAAAIGRIAWQEFSSGRALDPAAIDANYVRRSDAELLWKDPAAIR
jgi:tRNA threonylcarbamoyladenosine biosynthesis protein TsaB